MSYRTGHRIDADVDYIGAFLFEAVPAAQMVPDFDRDGLPDAPPPSSGYRDSDVAGIACWNCGHFSLTDPESDLAGVCNLWEAQATGEAVCDRFTAHADLLRQSPHTSWHEDVAQMQQSQMDEPGMMYSLGPSKMVAEFGEHAVLNEIGFAGGATVEEDGLIWKDILRTGHWTHTPTNQGVIAKSLDIIEEGESDPANGIISLSELVQNFDERAVPYVTIPLSDEEKKDHKNTARVNTGFVRKLKIVKNGAVALLRAGMDFTEPEIKEKVLRGTIPDVSSGIPFGVTRRRDNKIFKAVLDHVCLTRKPWIDGLGPFSIEAADDSSNLPVENFEEVERETEQSSTESADDTETTSVLSVRETEAAVGVALYRQLGLAQDYRVADIRGNDAIIEHTISNLKWVCPFTLTGNPDVLIQLSGVREWKLIEEPHEQIAASEPKPPTFLEELHQAHQLRESRLAQPSNDDTTGGIQMSVSDMSLDGVELSDEARTRIQGILDENQRLRRSDRSIAADRRIEELQALGLNEKPGALKLYRQIFLADDGAAAAVLFADDGETPKEKISAIEILDRFIDALKADGGVVFSDQALASGNDDKPANTAEGEADELETRVANAKEALYGKRTRRK